MTLLEQIDRVLTLAANQFARHSNALDKLVYHILDTMLLNGRLLLAVYWWRGFETDENGVHPQRRNVVVAQPAVIGVASAV